MKIGVCTFVRYREVCYPNKRSLTLFREIQKVGKKIDSKQGLHSKLTIMSMHVAHTEK